MYNAPTLFDGVELWYARSPHCPVDAVAIVLPKRALEVWDATLAKARADNEPIKVASLDDRSHANLAADLLQNSAALFGSEWAQGKAPP